MFKKNKKLIIKIKIKIGYLLYVLDVYNIVCIEDVYLISEYLVDVCLLYIYTVAELDIFHCEIKN